jgi:predicted DNA-binding transcriptional regulator YafY
MSTGKESLYNQLKKALGLLTYLTQHRFGATIKELSQELDITPRTVYRILQAFRELEIPITFTINSENRKMFRLVNRPAMAALLGIM